MRIVIAVEELQLLLPMAGIVRGIHIQDHFGGVGGQLGNDPLSQRHSHPKQVFASHCVFQARNGGLTGQSGLALGSSSAGELERRIVSERVQVVGIFISRSDCEHSRHGLDQA